MLYNLQFGFRKNYSTESAMNYLIDLIIDFLGKKLIIAVIFFDYSKAFDSINHNILLKKLKTNFNLDDTCIKWISSYQKMLLLTCY